MDQANNDIVVDDNAWVDFFSFDAFETSQAESGQPTNGTPISLSDTERSSAMGASTMSGLSDHFSFASGRPLPKSPVELWNEGRVASRTTFQQPLLEARPTKRRRLLLPNLAHGNTCLPEHFLDDRLKVPFEHAFNAVSMEKQSRFSHEDRIIPDFTKFRVTLPVEGLELAKSKRRRTPRSVARACLLCRHLKLKCSPGRPCVRCMEKKLGQRDLDFTSCIRDDPLTFNPFTNEAAAQDSLLEPPICHEVGLLCLAISQLVSCCGLPDAFIWAFSHMCYIRSYALTQCEGGYGTKMAASFWRYNQPKLSRLAFRDLEESLCARRTIRRPSSARTRSLIVALTLYAWLGVMSGRAKPVLSERQQVCKAYLTEYIDLLMPRCLPGWPSTRVRNLMWTMQDFRMFSIIPQLQFGRQQLRQMCRDIEVGVTTLRETSLRYISSPSLTKAEYPRLGEQFCSIYWPRWSDSAHTGYELTYIAKNFFPLYNENNQRSILWNLRPREAEAVDPVLRRTYDTFLEENPHRAGEKSLLEWIDDARMMLEEV